jgi:DNA-directed RNA polymerase alpha subunit
MKEPMVMTEKELEIKAELAKTIFLEIRKEDAESYVLITDSYYNRVVGQTIELTNKLFDGINPKPQVPEVPEDSDRPSILDKPLIECKITGRTRRLLSRYGVWTVGQMVQFHKADFMSLSGFGRASCREIEQCVYNNGLEFKGEKNRRDLYEQRIY